MAAFTECLDLMSVHGIEGSFCSDVQTRYVVMCG